MTLRYLKIGALPRPRSPARGRAAGPPLAQDGLFIPTFVYRTGAFAPNGIPIADGFKDYFTLLNERDGGIEGVQDHPRGVRDQLRHQARRGVLRAAEEQGTRS